MGTGLHRLREEDPTIHVRVDGDLHQHSLGDGGSPHRRRAREAGAALRRPRGTHKPRIPYRETIRRNVCEAGPAQEADRRPRAVRRRPRSVRAAEAGERIRVRGRDRGRVGPAKLHPRRREGRSTRRCTRGPGRLPDGRLPGRALRRLVSLRRLARKWRSRSPARSRSKRAMQEASPVLLEPIVEIEVHVPEGLRWRRHRRSLIKRGKILGMAPRRATT